MTSNHFHLFLAIIITISVIGIAIYTRYSYMGPHARYDFWHDEYQTMIERGEWCRRNW